MNQSSAVFIEHTRTYTRDVCIRTQMKRHSVILSYFNDWKLKKKTKRRGRGRRRESEAHAYTKKKHGSFWAAIYFIIIVVVVCVCFFCFGSNEMRKFNIFNYMLSSISIDFQWVFMYAFTHPCTFLHAHAVRVRVREKPLASWLVVAALAQGIQLNWLQCTVRIVCECVCKWVYNT